MLDIKYFILAALEDEGTGFFETSWSAGAAQRPNPEGCNPRMNFSYTFKCPLKIRPSGFVFT